MFLLDTDCFGLLQQASQPESLRLAERIANFLRRDFFISIVSFQEQVNGWNAYLSRAKRSEGVIRAYRKLQLLLTDFSQMQVLAFDDEAANLFLSLRSQGVRIGTLDLRIAASALSKDFTVISRNLVDFQRVPGLHVEDWTL